MGLKKKLDPRFKRKGDGTIEGDIRSKVLTGEQSEKYCERYDKIDWSVSKEKKND